MPTTINIRVELSPISTIFSDSMASDRDISHQGGQNLANELFAEVRKELSLQRHMSLLPEASDLLESSSDYVREGMMAVFDAYNGPALWLEISNVLLDIRYLLAQSKSYKDEEPVNSSPVSSALCAHLHFAKMHSFDLAVFQLAKIQDLVVRLLQENFGGQLIHVDYDEDGWERDLSMKDAKKGLNNLLTSGDLSHEDHTAICSALARPSQSSNASAIVDYRNRITHRLRPSVDYPELYTYVENRAGEIVKDESGNERGRQYGLGGTPTEPEFYFNDLYPATVDYMAHVFAMVKDLKQIPRLSSSRAKLL